MKPFEFKTCQVKPEIMANPTLAGCNNGINRYLKKLWRITFPDGTWTRCGTKNMAKAYINRVIYRHCLPGQIIPS